MSDIDQNISDTKGPISAPIISGDNNTLNYNVLDQEFPKISIKQSLIGKTKNFVGRKIFLDKIKHLFDEPNQPISIIGDAGLGKSQLAYEAISRFQTTFNKIILFDFTNFIKYEKFLSDFASYLDIPAKEFDQQNFENKIHVILDTLSKLDHVLIYADNFETVSSLLLSENNTSNTSDAKLIVKLLELVPTNTLMLLTSRMRNNLDDERIVVLEGLTNQEGKEMFIKLSKNLFSSNPSENMQKILEQISEKTGGHPLSIELLARSYKGNGIPEIQKMLEHLGVGVVNLRESNERLRSLDLCFEFSINLLGENHAKQLPKLSLFSSYFTPDGAKQILGIDCETLQKFYDCGLLRKIDFDEDDPLKFRLYGLHLATKNYFQKQIDLKSLEQEVSEQFVQYYKNLSDIILNSLFVESQPHSIERFKNMMYGENDFDKAIMLDSSNSSQLSFDVGWILKSLGNFSSALVYLKKALIIDEKNNNEIGMASDYNNIGLILQDQGNLDDALEYAKKALVINKKNNIEHGIATVYGNISLILKDQGKLDDALVYAKKVLNIMEKNDDVVHLAVIYNNVGLILQDQGKLDDALVYLKKALTIDEKNNDVVKMAIRYNNIGGLLHQQGKLDDALEYAKKALAISENIDDTVKLVIRYSNMGYLLKDMGNESEAMKYFKKASNLKKLLNP